MCYYKSRNQKEPQGWFFLKDVTSIEDDAGRIVIGHPVREFVLRAPTRAEHSVWVSGLLKICKDAR